MKKKISIIIRTKNEERWISQCLNAVFSQEFGDFEVIIVDNESSDKTIEKSRRFNIAKVLTTGEYLPGKALNMGIKNSSGDFIVCLSGHCIPTDNKWLGNLLKNFDGDPSVAGVYGRQEPMDFTSDSDKRDLDLVFGLDRKVQVNDTFFHNANSMIRRKTWEKVPFDESVTNIEDRVWAREVLKAGNRIIYEPQASVYHYHGIHQNGDAQRCTNVVRILESMRSGDGYRSIDLEKMNIVALIPVKGEVRYLAGKPLMEFTIKRAIESKYIKKAIVSTDNREIADIAVKLGAEAPFIRDKELSDSRINLDRVLQYSLGKIEEQEIFPDLVVSLEITFPFRPAGLIDSMVQQLAQSGMDSVVAARRENKAIWKEQDGRIVQLEEGLTPRQFKDPAFIELRGVCCVTHPEFLRAGSLLGRKVGIYEVGDPRSSIEVRSEEDFNMAAILAGKFFEEEKRG